MNFDLCVMMMCYHNLYLYQMNHLYISCGVKLLLFVERSCTTTFTQAGKSCHTTKL